MRKSISRDFIFTFVPTSTMPSLVRAFAENQPVTPIVEAIRNLLTNQPVGNEIWTAIADSSITDRYIL